MAAGKIRKKIKKELIGTSDYPSNKIFTISNFITFTRLILTGVFLYLFVTDQNRYVALAIYAIAASTDWLDGSIATHDQDRELAGKDARSHCGPRLALHRCRRPGCSR